MDLETIGKQMLESLAIQGQMAGLGTKISDLEKQITEVNGEIQKSKDEKALSVKARGEAEDLLVGAISNAKAIKASLKSAESAVEKAKDEVSKYGDDILNQLGGVTQRLEEIRKATEANKDEILKELDATKKALEARQVELKAHGIELNLGGAAPQPKTTIL